MLPNLKTYTCKDCKVTGEFTGYRQARRENWAINKSYTKCYCPNCAPRHRRGKAADKNGEPPQLSKGWEQLEIVNF